MILITAGTSGLGSFFRLVGVLLIFVFVLAITYVSTRWIATYQRGMNANKNIQVLETFRITNNKYIQIVKIGKACLAIAVCKDTISVLCRLEEDELEWKPDSDAPVSGMPENFADILSKLKGKLPRK